jgi:hypothetical protein
MCMCVVFSHLQCKYSFYLERRKVDLKKFNPGSWNVTENVRTNLEKVEELFLYTIEQQKQIEAQQKEINELKAMVKELVGLKKEKTIAN